MLSELIETLSQAQERLQMMGKDCRVFSKDTAPLEFVLKVAKRPAAVHLHEWCFEEAFNGIPGHIHRTAAQR